MIQTPSTIIQNIEQLRDYLQVALKLEHATIPVYLTAAYTANVEENNESRKTILNVAREEMLHLTLVANLLNAIGGAPDLVRSDFVPAYPTLLPTGQDDFDIDIERFSQKAIETFLQIERPTTVEQQHHDKVGHIIKTVELDGQHIDQSIINAQNPFVRATKIEGQDKYLLNYDIAVVPHHNLTKKRLRASERKKSIIPRVTTQIDLHYWSIGEFYKAIHLGFTELTRDLGPETVFTGDLRKQIPPEYYWGGGSLLKVTDLRTAHLAIELIAGQGEGSHGQIVDSNNELSHYYRFDQILKGRYYRVPSKKNEKDGDVAGKPKGGKFNVNWEAAFPIKANAKVSDYYADAELEKKALLLNGRYKNFLTILNDAFNGNPKLLEGAFQAEMRNIGRAIEELVHIPIPGTNQNAAPTFEMDVVKYETQGERVVSFVTDIDPFEAFLLLSVQLCGISRTDLLGSGYADRYFKTIEEIVGSNLLQRLFNAFNSFQKDCEIHELGKYNELLRKHIVDHLEFGPVARNIIKLWYTATWFELPFTWTQAFGERPNDKTHIPYPYAYTESFLGPAVGAHPAGAKPTGYQSWTLPPHTLDIPPECI